MSFFWPNLIIEIIGIIFCAMGLMQLYTGVRTDRVTERFLSVILILQILFCTSNIAGMVMSGQPGEVIRILLIMSNFSEFFLSVLMVFTVSAFMQDLVDPEHANPGMRRTIQYLLLVSVVLLVISQFTNLYYTIDGQNIYRRMPGYPVSYIIPAILLIMDIIVLRRHRDKLLQKEVPAFWVYLCTPFVAMIVQIFFYGLNFVQFFSIVTVAILYAVVSRVRAEAYEELLKENKKLRTEIFLSQIRPHFLFNSLATIRQLCADNPKAADAVAKFSKYLRGNLEALTGKETIPFEKELEYTKVYLDLEKLRFGDDLEIVFDLKSTDFSLPTLTMQPIVENAVRHGVRGKESGQGCVTISTREYPDRYEVSVLDDGPGFKPAEGGGPGHHIGLNNVRERLEHVCGGSLLIESESGNGSQVTLVIPKDR